MKEIASRKMARSGRRRVPALAFSVLGVMAFDAAVAEACLTDAPPPAIEGYPADGDEGVPTDVKPIFYVRDLYEVLNVPPELDYNESEGIPPSWFELVDERGVVIDLLPSSGDGQGFGELVPSTALVPRTRYTARIVPEWSVGDSLQLSFTTGDGPYASVPAPPAAAIEHYHLESDWTSCSPWPTGTCIAFAEPAPGVYIEERGFRRDAPDLWMYAYLSRTPRFTNISGIDQGTPYDCIALRARGPNGVFSEALTLCREDGELLEIRGSEDIACTEAGITQDGQLVSALPAASGGSGDGEPPTSAGPESPPTDEGTADAALPADPARCGLAAGGTSSSLDTLLSALALSVLALRRRRTR